MKKLIALLLTLAMAVAMIPLSVSAEDDYRHHHHHHHHKKPVHVHVYNRVEHNMKYHWKECACGQKISMEPHIDPKDAKNDYCTCGFHFNDNADLVTLWVDGCEEIKNFNKNKTEYTLKTVSYKDVKEVEIRFKAFDDQSTVELPEDLTLKDGNNVFAVKVTSGNHKVTKTYTLTIVK